MAMQVCTKTTSKLKLLHRKTRFLSKDLVRFLCKTLIHPHFDYGCAVWYPDLNEKYPVLQLASFKEILAQGMRFRLGMQNSTAK